MGGGWGWGRVESWRWVTPPTGPFVVAMSPRNTSHRPRKPEGPKRCLKNTGVNIKSIPPIQCPPWVPLSQS